MHKLYELDDGAIREAHVHDMDFHRLKWLDLENPTSNELQAVSDVIKVSRKKLRQFVDRHELPRLGTTGPFTSIVLQAPFHIGKRKGITTTSLVFLISERLLITRHRDHVASLTEIAHDDQLPQFLGKGVHDFFTHIIEHIIGDYFIALDGIESQINVLENAVLNNPTEMTVRMIFNLKRTLVFFHKSLAHNRDLLTRLKKEFPESADRIDFLHNEVIQQLDMVATYRDLIVGLLDVYLSAVSNNMNMIMKKMAAYGTLVLVPTFITGLYGMNFSIMPELSWKYGYVFAWALMIGSFSSLVWYFKKKQWF